MPAQKFYPVPGFPQYEIARNGVVRRVGTKRVLKPQIHGRGYTRVTLCKEGKPHVWLLHRLLGLVFIPNPENHTGMNHKNGVRSDNRLENLEWVSQRDNVLHAYRLGLRTPSRAPRPELRTVAPEIIVQMQAMRNDRYKLREIAKKFGVTISMVWRYTEKRS